MFFVDTLILHVGVPFAFVVFVMGGTVARWPPSFIFFCFCVFVATYACIFQQEFHDDAGALIHQRYRPWKLDV